MKRIYFVRHGESEANVNRTVQGPDDRLTAIGERQAAKVAERVKHLPVDMLISSDYTRTRQTVEQIARLTGKEPLLSELFREARRPSHFIGLHREEALEQNEEYRLYVEGEPLHIDDPDWRVGDGENTHDLIARGKAALSFLETQEGNDIVVVTHGYFLRLLSAIILKQGELSAKDALIINTTLHIPSNTSITVCTWSGGVWRLLTWNDYAHFAE